MQFSYPEGATPIDGDELEGLLPKHISFQTELNAWEQLNILEAEKWAFGTPHDDLLTLDSIKRLHLKMFGETWRWAGQFRKTLKNIGEPAHEIPQELLKLCGDVQAQLDYRSSPLEEIAIRLHHRMVLIHPFSNGNGRHGRIFTDLLLTRYQAKRFSWGRDDLLSPTQTRMIYIKALREADRGNIMPLLEFAQS